MKEALFAVLRGTLSYVLLLIVCRIIGRKIISQMTFFDYVVAITFGSLAANLGMGSNKSPLTAGIVIFVFAILSLATSTATIKSMKMRKLIISEPIVVVAKGELVKKNLAKARMNVGMLNELLREKSAFDIMDVEYAIMESNGQLSVLLKSNKQPLTPSDMNIATPYQGLATEIIIDGVILEENLWRAGKDEAWLINELRNRGIGDAKNVFFAALDSSGALYLSRGIQTREEHGQYGIE